MQANTKQSNATAAQPGSKTATKDDLKSLPLAELEKILGSSPDGLTQAEAQIP
jgi:H+-transporting ATPase